LLILIQFLEVNDIRNKIGIPVYPAYCNQVLGGFGFGPEVTHPHLVITGRIKFYIRGNIRESAYELGPYLCRFLSRSSRGAGINLYAMTFGAVDFLIQDVSAQ